VLTNARYAAQGGEDAMTLCVASILDAFPVALLVQA
jgi:hypothetical protein